MLEATRTEKRLGKILNPSETAARPREPNRTENRSPKQAAL